MSHIPAMPPPATPAPWSLREGRVQLDFGVPLVMGILNATPDSFHSASRVTDVVAAATRAGQMVEAGADIIDIGGQSTRPGAVRVESGEEADRVLPVIAEIRERWPDLPLSIDTYHAEVARQALEAGADIVNDVGAARLDPDMAAVIARFAAPCILMHMQGTPSDMQERPEYADVVAEVRRFLEERLDTLGRLGIRSMAVDPGFGFGKTIDHNFALLDGLHEFASLGVPVLAGISRKSMIHKTLGITPEQALNGSSVLHAWALERGVHILRVHDVAEAAECVKLHRALTRNRTGH